MDEMPRYVSLACGETGVAKEFIMIPRALGKQNNANANAT